MRLGFTQTAEHRITDTISENCLGIFPDAIHRHTEWIYSCKQTDNGYYLKPTFRNMPYRNSFVPELDIEISQDDGMTVLHMRGRPVKSVRYFSAFFTGCCLAGQIIVIAILLTSGMDTLVPLFIPAALLVFNFLLCKSGTKFSFAQVVKAIRNEFP